MPSLLSHLGCVKLGLGAFDASLGYSYFGFGQLHIDRTNFANTRQRFAGITKRLGRRFTLLLAGIVLFVGNRSFGSQLGGPIEVFLRFV